MAPAPQCPYPEDDAVLPVLTLLTASALGFAAPADSKVSAPEVGAVVPDFRLKDIHRRPRSLDGYKDRKAFVVAFIDTECPVANLYIPALIDAAQGVRRRRASSSWRSIPAARTRSPASRPMRRSEACRSRSSRTSTSPSRTPSAPGGRPRSSCSTPTRAIRYHGRIDDRYGIGFRRDQPTRGDLKEALDELLAGRPIATPRTDVAGCPIERSRNPRSGQEVTYARQVSRIIQARCQECHRPGEIGPFSLLTFEDAEKRTSRIREAVLEERMPPWHADPHYGRFANDRRLSQDERDTLLAWIDAGAP